MYEVVVVFFEYCATLVGSSYQSFGTKYRIRETMKRFILLKLEDGTDTLSRNVGNLQPTTATQHLWRAKTNTTPQKPESFKNME